MMLAWFGRFGIIFAIVAPIALIVFCGVYFVSPWISDSPCLCGFYSILDPSPHEMRIIPQWYLLPAYAVLRAVTIDFGFIDTKTLGIVMLCAMFIAPFSLSFFSWSRARASARFSLLALWPILIGLWWIGLQVPTDVLASVSVILIAAYFALFLIVFPLLARKR